jgi:UDP-N-acetyl-D-mannosaminuronic acid dehydrogenase
MKEFEKICVIGQGYIGLPTSAILAQAGFKVLGVDINERVVTTINKGQVHISEPDLDGLVQKMVSSGKLMASTKPEEADAFIIAVPTPILNDTRPDLAYVFDAARLIAPVLREENLVILESTVPVGTTEMVADMLAVLRPDLTFPQQRSIDRRSHQALLACRGRNLQAVRTGTDRSNGRSCCRNGEAVGKRVSRCESCLCK